MDLSVFVFVCQWMNELKFVRCNGREKKLPIFYGEIRILRLNERNERKKKFPFVLCTMAHSLAQQSRLTYLPFCLFQSNSKKYVTVVNRKISCLPVSVSNEIRLIELTSNALFVQIIFYHAVRFIGCINSFRMNSDAEKIGISRFFKHNDIFWKFNNDWK